MSWRAIQLTYAHTCPGTQLRSPMQAYTCTHALMNVEPCLGRHAIALTIADTRSQIHQ